MPDPGLTDLIAAALVRSSPNSIDTFDLLPYHRQEAWRVRAREVASVVEQHTNGRHEWPKTTPTGFTYERPTTYAALEHMIGHMVQSEIECWDEPERPPEPVWEMIGIAQQEVGRERARAEKAEATIARVEKLQRDLFQQGGNLIAQWGAARLIGTALEGES
ncbi:hypothetical protein [Rhodococcus sp. NPDC060176]|uniref:hypothetical protein n=1 Tax=Rhodococcus sp. NPDC060176 TaxID=3347062 RepID=UPI003663631F